MTKWQLTAAIANKNQQALQRLIRAIKLSNGQFALILVRCNYGQLREQMLGNLRLLTEDINLRELVLKPSTTALHTTIIAELFLDYPAVVTDSLPSSVMVFGLESITHLEDLISGINQARDIYAASFPFPLVLWLQDDIAAILAKLAPDFKSWAATTIKFELAKENLITLIRQETESLFAKILAAGTDKFLSNASLDLAPKSQSRHEIESARNDLLRLYSIKLEPELEASLEFVLGRDEYANDKIPQALTHYQKSLILWQQLELDKTRLGNFTENIETYSPNPPILLSRPQLRQAVVMFHLGLCYRRMADLNHGSDTKYWQDALLWFKQCLEILEKAERQDLVAKFILSACEMLQRLQAWEDLAELAQKSLQLHETYGIPAQIAQDYGFLAAVAVGESNWLLADELVNKALAIAELATEVSRQQESWYLLLLARTQRNLGKSEEAINNLEWAKVVCELQYEPSLYLEILEELRSLYFFGRRDYAEAFILKQEKIQIEHQYGFRAFIGASQLQPQRYRINPVLEPQKIPFIPEEIAQEIAAAGRQQDVNRLIERITRADYKLTVIHGPSGVGKSSTLKAGLVPALKGKIIGERIPLPIVLSVYTDWVTALGRSINHVISQTEISIPEEMTPTVLIEKLRLASERNHTIIIIFDQFEEFFFISTSPTKKAQFYRFFSECLNIPYIKIILSLREDYLHYLLEFERLSKENSDGLYDLGVINKNILDKDIRYYLGNFTRHDAISIVQSLTKRSYSELSEELIHKIVDDLSAEINEVHPIELQIVGAQLQAENITTLEQYQLCGGSKKLVERWLQEVIKDCGQENEERSWKLLFELTDEKGTRPLKTKADFVAALGNKLEPTAEFDTNWEFILEILVGSGLVLREREELGDRYQLVHDYLVEPIRQKNDHGMVAELEKAKFEKTRAEAAHKLSQEQLTLVLQRRLREARIAGVALAIMASTVAVLWWQADLQKRAALRQTRRAERSEINFKISAIAAASEALFASNKEFDALLESLRAWRKFKQADDVQPDTRMRVVTALQQAVYGVEEVNRLEGHSDIVWSVAFSPDGQLLASGSLDKEVKLWRPNGKLLQTLAGHSDAVTSVSFSPDGQTLASASLDKTVQLWRKNPITGEFDPRPHQTLEGHGDWIYSVSFSPDGELLATGSKDATIKIWRPDGSLVKILRGHQGWVNWVTFSPDGQLIASASEDKTVKIWRRDGSLIATLPGHQGGVRAVAFSPDGQILASGGRDRIVKLWRRNRQTNADGFDFRPYKTLRQHSSNIWHLSFSPDGNKLASGSDDNTINLWSITGSLLKTFKGHSDAVASVAFSPDNSLLASASFDKSVKLWRLDAPTLPILQGHKDRVLSVAWSPDGRMLASGSKDKTVKLWRRDWRNGKLETRLYKTLVGHKDEVPSVSFDSQGEILASGSFDKTVKLWRRDGSLYQTLTGHSGSVNSVNFSPDGQLLASASKDKTVKLWSRQGKLLKTLVGHHDRVNSVNFSPDGQVLASASDDRTVKLWRRDGTLIKTFPHDSWVLGVSFSPTAQLLASASWDNTVKLWRRDGTFIKTLLKGYSDSVSAVTFSPRGELIAAASFDKSVKLWSREGKLIKTLTGHHGAVLGVSFSPDGQTLASASVDNTIILWNLDLDDLLGRGCNWVNDYLKYNRNVEGRDRRLCDTITRKR